MPRLFRRLRAYIRLVHMERNRLERDVRCAHIARDFQELRPW